MYECQSENGVFGGIMVIIGACLFSHVTLIDGLIGSLMAECSGKECYLNIQQSKQNPCYHIWCVGVFLFGKLAPYIFIKQDIRVSYKVHTGKYIVRP